MRYRDDELKRAREVMQASIGKYFHNADFEKNISTSIRFKTQALRESRLRFESSDSDQASKQSSLMGLSTAIQDLSSDVRQLQEAKSTTLSQDMRLVLDSAKDEVKESLEHFKPEEPESAKKRPIRIDSEFFAKVLAALLQALIQMLSFGKFGKEKQQTATIEPR